MRVGETLAERGWLPDSVLLSAMRRQFEARLKASRVALASGEQARFIASLADAPIAIATDAANEQHYELPTSFFELVLGPHLKYSSALYETPESSLAEAEAAMLSLTCARAGLLDGMQILELGCGWGSLSLWMAEHYPKSSVLAVSNSATQRAHIEAACHARGLDNLTVVTQDMNTFAPPIRFDRVVSVEMFEHMRNWPELLRRVRTWLSPEGRLFLHVFCHSTYCYPYVADADSWMSRYFFTGGIMPSFDLLHHFSNDLRVEQRWEVNGAHYGRTLRAWLDRMDAQRDAVLPILAETYGPQDAARWFQRWRMFFLASSAFFHYREGREWYVGHYLLAPIAPA